MSIGICGHLVNTGIGSLIDDLKRNLPITSHLVTPHVNHGIDARKMDPTCVISKNTPGDTYRWICGQKAVIFVEYPTISGLPEMCRKRGVPMLCQVDVDWFNPRLPWVSQVTLFVAPNLTTYRMLTQVYRMPNVRYIPAVVDTKYFPFRQRTRCDAFLFNNGWGGYIRRKGGDLVQAAARVVSGTLLVHSQIPYVIAGSPKLQVRLANSNCEDRRSLYAEGDVYLAPTRWEGFGLHIVEALACGMPTLVTDGPPMTDYVKEPRWRIGVHSVIPAPHKGRFTPIVCSPKVQSLIMRMQEWRGTDISDASIEARKIAEEFSWGQHGPTYLEILRGWGALS